MDILDILKKSLSHEENYRKEAELTILNYAKENFQSLLVTLSDILLNEEIEIPTRQIACILLKNLISNMIDFKGKWNVLDKEIKNQIKEKLILNLNGSQNIIRKFSSLIIAGICKVDFRNNESFEIIDLLCKTIESNPNQDLRSTYLINLGYIFQEIKTSEISKEHVSQCVKTLYNAFIGQNTDFVLIEALKSFQILIPFMKSIFESENERKTLFQELIKFTQNPNEEIRIVSFRILGDIASFLYDYISEDMLDFVELTKLHLEKDTEEIKILCYEFWLNIVEIEITRNATRNKKLINKKYSEKYYQNYLPLIFNDLKRDEKEDSYSNKTLFFQASTLLSGFSECCSAFFLDETLSLIIENISNSNEIIKKSGLVAFGSILKSPHKEKLNSIIADSIQNFYDLILAENISLNLKETVFWVLIKISKYFPIIFENERQKLDGLINIIQAVLQSQNKKIISNSFEIIRVLYKHFKPEEGQNSNILSAYTKNLLVDLYAFSKNIPSRFNIINSREDESENDLVYQIYSTLSTIIENSALDTKLIINEFFTTILDDCKKTLVVYGFDPKSPGIYINNVIKSIYQNCYCLCLSSILVSGLINVNFQIGKEISELIFYSFKEREEVFEEAIYVISELALVMGDKFEIIFKEGFGFYLLNAIKSSDINLKRVALIAISDIMRALKQAFDPYTDEILPLLITILKDETNRTKIKNLCISLLTDIFMFCPNKAINLLPNVINEISFLIDFAYARPDENEDVDILEENEELRQNIIEFFNVYFFTLKDMKRENEFKTYLSPIIKFIYEVNSDDFYPSLQMMQTSIALIGDFCDIYKKEMRELINLNIVKNIFESIKEYKLNRKSKEIIRYSEEKINSIVTC